MREDNLFKKIYEQHLSNFFIGTVEENNFVYETDNSAFFVPKRMV